MYLINIKAKYEKRKISKEVLNKDMEYCNLISSKYIKENGKIIFLMENVSYILVKDGNIRAVLKWENFMDKVIYSIMELGNARVFGLKIFCK